LLTLRLPLTRAGHTKGPDVDYVIGHPVCDVTGLERSRNGCALSDRAVLSRAHALGKMIVALPGKMMKS